MAFNLSGNICEVKNRRDCIKFPDFQPNKTNLLTQDHMETSCLSASVFGVKCGADGKRGVLGCLVQGFGDD